MSMLPELKDRFRRALREMAEEAEELLDLIRRSQDPRFGDYQANFAMPLGKRLGRPPREVAAAVVNRLDVADFCHPPEIAGPGFINLRIKDDWLSRSLAAAVADPAQRLCIPVAARPRTYVIDYSAPNVAKPMHVGHIRSTVIGDALCRVLRFLGHGVISDNHLGDWGTQFGMIIYGYKHRDIRDYVRERLHPNAQVVDELAGLYVFVRLLIEYHETKANWPKKREEMCRKLEAEQKNYDGEKKSLEEKRRNLEAELGAEIRNLQKSVDRADRAAVENYKKAEAKLEKAMKALERNLQDLKRAIDQEDDARGRMLRHVESDPHRSNLAKTYPSVGSEVLAETAKLHSGDPENLRLWREFMPYCLEEINRIYQRLDIHFDHTLGESFYQDRLAALVDDLLKQDIARESDGAICVFLDGHEVPMLIRKQDGAFLYATTDLATIRYRMEEFRPDAILYVVDHRQSLHFEQLFATARRMGYRDVELEHVSFGTVLGDDGRPFRTRSGDTVGLEGLLDEAVRRAAEIVGGNDDAKPDGPELTPEQRAMVAETVGIAALKYADLSQNRTSDYVFSYDKMLAMNGNTATYMQYAYARVRSIFARGGVDVAALRASGAPIVLGSLAERALGLELLRFAEALELTVADYRPNQLTAYLFDLANRYSTFFEQCPVLKAESAELRLSRLLLCDLTARTIQKGLELLGIKVVEKM
jgi:arginyl-tRNA synthetase